jgi:transglutaminase-like putative cysteine protease
MAYRATESEERELPKKERALVVAVLSFFFSILFPIVFGIVLRSSISSIFFVFILGIKTLLYTGAYTSAYHKRSFKILSRLSTYLYATLMLLAILITPYSAYRLWLENFSYGYSQGPVSNLITLLIGFFSSLFSSTFFYVDFVWPFLGMALMSAILFAFILKTGFTFFIVVVALLLCIAYSILKRGRDSYRLRLVSHLSVLITISIIATIIFSANKTPEGNLFIDHKVYPFLRQTAVSLFPNIPLPEAVPGYGFSFNETTRLGGKPMLSSKPLFQVFYPKRGKIYLRTRTYDTYNGTKWKWSQPSARIEKGEVLLSSKVRAPDEIHIKLLTEFYSLLPHTLETIKVRFQSGTPNIERGNWETGISLLHPLKKQQEFYIQVASSSSDIPRNIRPIAKGAYLQVPEDLPNSVRFLATQLRQGTEDTKTILERIVKYLAFNYSYTLEMEEEYGYYEDFVADFLFGELQGYCVHFATSFILLARLNGIPARYATGFLVENRDGSKATIVTGTNSHAWPEVWLSDRGWTTWEATPAVVPDIFPGPEDDWLYNIIQSFNLGDDLGGSLAGIDSLSNTRAVQESASDRSHLLRLLWFAFIPLAVGLFLVLRRPVYQFTIMRKKNRDSFLYLTSKIVSNLKKLGIEGPQRGGWICWGEDVQGRFPSTSRYALRVTRIINTTIFGRYQTAAKDIEYLKLFYKKLRSLNPNHKHKNRIAS